MKVNIKSSISTNLISVRLLLQIVTVLLPMTLQLRRKCIIFCC